MGKGKNEKAESRMGQIQHAVCVTKKLIFLYFPTIRNRWSAEEKNKNKTRFAILKTKKKKIK